MGPFSFLLSLLLVDLELFLSLLILPPMVRVLVFLSHHSLQRSLLTDTRHIRAAKRCRVNHVPHSKRDCFGGEPTRIGGSGHEPEYSQQRVQVAFEKLRAWRAVELRHEKRYQEQGRGTVAVAFFSCLTVLQQLYKDIGIGYICSLLFHS